MTRLENITADQLRDYLETVEHKRPTLRLVVGINYKEGVSQSELADWYGISRTTVHNWLTRLERLTDKPIEEVVYDADRPGRPRKLSPRQWGQLESILEQSPEAIGVDAADWTPELVRVLIHEKFGVEYSTRHVRELLNQAGFSWQTTRLDSTLVTEETRTRLRNALDEGGSPD